MLTKIVDIVHAKTHHVSMLKLAAEHQWAYIKPQYRTTNMAIDS